MVRVGLVGAGQLARMMIGSSLELGLQLKVWAATANDPAASSAVAFGELTDTRIADKFLTEVDIIGFDHEVMPEVLVEKLISSGKPIRPQPSAFRYTQNKIALREKLESMGLPQPRWRVAGDAQEVAAFRREQPEGKLVVKLPTGGYDGRGVLILSKDDDENVELREWLARGGGVVMEEFVPFRRELSQVLVRGSGGAIVQWALAESHQRDGQCYLTITPAPGTNESDALSKQAAGMASTIAEELDVVGVLAVELFETGDGELLINELAMRPHNSAHWTIEGAVSSQFEQHLRAIAGLPLGSSELRAPVAVMVNLIGGVPGGQARVWQLLAEHPEAKLHYYAKEHRPRRKMGHVTLLGDDAQALLKRASRISEAFTGN